MSVNKPERPPPPPSNPGSGYLSVGFTMFVMVAGVTLLLWAPFGAIGIAFVVGGLIFPAIIAFHYFTWGRYLQRVFREEGEFDDD
ncbi:MAG: hypothetical protein QGG36_01500 [Pirellulaceae bacterium]|nr:hypothetical protein [Pirellulaceae bacterium]